MGFRLVAFYVVYHFQPLVKSAQTTNEARSDHKAYKKEYTSRKRENKHRLHFSQQVQSVQSLIARARNT